MVNIGDITTQDGATNLPAPKNISFSRDVSVAGSQSVTGLGFKPTWVLLMGAVNQTNANSLGWHGDGASGAGMVNLGQVSNEWSVTSAAIDIWTSGTFPAGPYNRAYAQITSYDSDGFTLLWTKTNTPTGTASCYGMVVK